MINTEINGQWLLVMWVMGKSLSFEPDWGWNPGSISCMNGQILNHYVPLLPHLHNGGTMVMLTLWGYCED